jgi:DNA-binding SARP family transcriptional activator
MTMQLTEPRTSIEDLRFQVLGPLVVRYRGADVTPKAPKRRAVLTALLLEANRTVSTSVLCRELWGDTPPRSAGATLQTYIFALRTSLREAMGLSSADVSQELLLTSVGGYSMRLEPGQLDVQEFDDLVSAGTAALHDGDHAGASDLLQRSLALWRGPIVYEGCQWGTRARAQVARLEERRGYAYVMRLEADLCLGRHHELVSELASFAVDEPLRETAQALFMIALHRSGRTAAALDHYRRFRRVMRSEVGIELSVRIQTLHQALLLADPVLDDRNLTSAMLLDLLTIGGPSAR